MNYLVTHINHADYTRKVRTMSDAALHYTMKDARAAMVINPTGIKAGYYADEVHYCADELARRVRGSKH